MPKRNSVPEKRTRRRGTLESYRREVIARIPRKFLASLTPEQRQFLGYTRGNPHVETAVFRLVAALLRAESVLNRFPTITNGETLRQPIDRQEENRAPAGPLTRH